MLKISNGRLALRIFIRVQNLVNDDQLHTDDPRLVVLCLSTTQSLSGRRTCHRSSMSLPCNGSQRVFSWTGLLAVALLVCLLPATAGKDEDGVWKPVVKEESNAQLFEPSMKSRVLSPTHFPKPTRKIDDEAVPIVEPAFGRHRSVRDAVFAYAEGYRLPSYMMFIETLKATGFSGDVVLAIAEKRIIKPDVEDYLRSYALDVDSSDADDDDEMHVVVYQTPLKCEDGDGATTDRRVMPSGDTDVFQMCQLSHVYGWKDDDGVITRTAEDPRGGRVVATLRYEWYWIWSLRYQPESWLTLLDARDSFFQSNPFADLPRQTGAVDDGLLYLFGENADATRLGKSTKNANWLRNGYGDRVLSDLAEKPTICSGSTMGEQIAVETYLRAMVNEHDECRIKMTGSDQGFHNYLYYSSKLQHAATIRRIVVWEQGRGAINNLGALRTKTLAEWGIYNEKTHSVYQWDGTTKSPVLHQFDRDKHLHSYMVGKRNREWELEWQNKARRI